MRLYAFTILSILSFQLPASSGWACLTEASCVAQKNICVATASMSASECISYCNQWESQHRGNNKNGGASVYVPCPRNCDVEKTTPLNGCTATYQSCSRQAKASCGDTPGTQTTSTTTTTTTNDNDTDGDSTPAGSIPPSNNTISGGGGGTGGSVSAGMENLNTSNMKENMTQVGGAAANGTTGLILIHMHHCIPCKPLGYMALAEAGINGANAILSMRSGNKVSCPSCGGGGGLGAYPTYGSDSAAGGGDYGSGDYTPPDWEAMGFGKFPMSKLQDIMAKSKAGIAELKSQGYSMDASGNVHTPSGGVITPAQAAAMAADGGGASAGELAAIQAAQAAGEKAQKEILAGIKMPNDGGEASGGGGHHAGGGGGYGGDSGNDGLNAYLKSLMKKREIASVHGLQQFVGGDPIHVKGANIFTVIKEKYQDLNARGEFLGN